MQNRRSIRLRSYDYSTAGGYFVTVCTKNRACLFGEIKNGEMILNAVGKIIESEWLKTSKIRPNTSLDEYIVMPDHFHAIIHIRTGVLQYARTQYAPTQYARTPSAFRSPSQTIGAIVRGFKSAATKRVNEYRNTPGVPVWQRNYYERVIRNEKELRAIREYIRTNPYNVSNEWIRPRPPM